MKHRRLIRRYSNNSISNEQNLKIKKAKTFVEAKLQIPHKNNVFFVKFKSDVSKEITKSISTSITSADNDNSQIQFSRLIILK